MSTHSYPSEAYSRYIDLAEYANKSGRTERALEYLYTAAYIAWKSNIRWKDGRAERLLRDLGNTCVDGVKENPDNINQQDESILYIATSLADQGGHSDVLRSWSNLLAESKAEFNQEVVVTNQSESQSDFPNLRRHLQDDGTDITELDSSNSYTNRIQILARTIIEKDFDEIVFFTDPNDIIAISSIHGVQNPPEVIFYNHADHVFWLGTEIIDRLIEHRSAGKFISQQYRDLDSYCIIPLTTNIKTKYKKSKKLVSHEGTVSLSIGSSYKLSPNLGYNYFKCLNKILTENTSHRHILITSGAVEENVHQHIDQDVRNRIHCYGPMSDLAPAYEAADILLDTFPYAGGLVKIEAAAYEIPIVSLQIPGLTFLSDVDILPQKYDYRATTEQEYVDYTGSLILNESYRGKTGKALGQRFDSEFSRNSVRERLLTVLMSDTPPKWNQTKHHPQIDMEAYSRLFNEDIDENLHYLRGVSMKESDINIFSRLNFFISGLSNNEISSPFKFVIYFVLALSGNSGYQILANIRSKAQDLYR